jgi:serine/threonine protein kinase
MRRQVAIKVLPPKMARDPATVERFYREAQAIALLDHQNIVRAFDVAHEGDLHYLVMEYVKGQTLEDLVNKDGPLSPLKAIDFLRQAAMGLQHAFEAGLVHRDIKPSNFLISENGTLKILDLGLARFFNEPTSSVEEKADGSRESVMGTADYMSPEQGLNTGPVDTRGDIYSLGATFYFCLRGKAPFEGAHTAQKLLWHQMREPDPLQNFRSDLPPQLIAVVSQMMAKDPAHRFQTPAEILAALPSQESVDLPVVVIPQAAIDTGLNLDSESPTLTLKRQRPQAAPGWRPSVVQVAGAFVVLAIVAVGIYLSSRSSTPKPVADPEPPQAKPTPAKPALAGANPTTTTPRSVWLCDLTAHDPNVGHGQLGKGNMMGFDNHKIVVKGVPYQHGLSMHAVSKGTAYARFEIGNRGHQLSFAVAMNDSSGDKAKTAVVFLVKGDGKTLYESPPVRVKADAQPVQTISVEGVRKLELEVRCPGDGGWGHAVWLDPSMTLR